MAHPLVNDIAMNLDDESLLSAYIDGQLDPDQLLAVESALLSNPRLSEQLQSLTSLRELVGGLSRDVSVDVSFAVLDRIRSPRPRWGRLPATIAWPTHRRRVLQATGLLGIAASILVAIIALNFPKGLQPRRFDPTSDFARSKIASNRPKLATNPGPIRDETDPGSQQHPSSSDSSISGDGEPETVMTGDIARTDATGKISDLVESRDLEQVRKLLDSPNLRRFFLVRGGRDGTARQQVASVVEQTTHVGFYKITISHGIVIDPHHPEEATVFALVVNPKELDNLKDRLNAALPDSVEETPVDPKVVTQLADIGQVQACPVTPIVTIPPDSLAMRTQGADARDLAAAEIQPVDKRPTVEQEQSGPVPPDRIPKADQITGTGSDVGKNLVAPATSPAHSDEPGPGQGDPQIAPQSPSRGRSTAKPDDTIVVLVWVTKSPSG